MVDFGRYYQFSMIFIGFGIGFELATILTFSMLYQGVSIGFFLLGFLFLRKSRKILNKEIKKAESVM